MAENVLEPQTTALKLLYTGNVLLYKKGQKCT